MEGLSAKLRYASGLGGFLRQTTSVADARQLIEGEMARRPQSFLRLVELGIYANLKNPLRAILLDAGIEHSDLQRMVEQAGLEKTLGTLYDEGVYLTYEEIRGRAPIKRGNLELQVEEGDFDNPLLEHQYEMQSTSSRSAGTRSFLDLTVLAHETAQFALFLQAHGALGRPVALWRPAALPNALRYARLGQAPARWFSQSQFPGGFAGLRSRALMAQTFMTSRLVGNAIGWPTFVPRDKPLPVVHWLEEMRRRGTPALIDTTASAATRVCLAARDSRSDISGTVFRVGGEPYTPAKAAVITSVGARGINGYAATELGVAGLGCATPLELDDLHVMTDRLLVLSRDKQIDNSGATVPALLFTTLLPNSRKVMINADCGDYGWLAERECGCLLGEVGFTTHVTGLHGYDKLTSEGVTFMGAELFTLLEEVLPARFGGDPTDYQLAEEEDSNGIPHVYIVVAPGVGDVDEVAVQDTVYQALQGYDQRYQRGLLMSEQWRQASTLSVVRREPYTAGGRKLLPLHILPPAAYGRDSG